MSMGHARMLSSQGFMVTRKLVAVIKDYSSLSSLKPTLPDSTASLTRL